MSLKAPILAQQCGAALLAAQNGSTGIMERAQDGIELRLLDGKSLDAANDPVIDGAQPASGWDPFEIWRTRVRDLVPGQSTQGKDTID